MNDTKLFISPLGNTEIFSVVNSIIILRELLFNNTQLILTTQVEPILIINALCEFLDSNSHSENRIISLGHQLLKGTDFYGSKETESLDLKFVNSVFNQIIANTVFSKFGNTFGFLAAIVNSTKDLKLSSVKQRITKNLHQQTFLNDNGTSMSLTNLTITRITKQIIFPLFPKSKKNLEIVHFKYIYAQAGWLLLRSAKENVDNPSFSKLIALAINLEQGVLQGQMDPSALHIFQLPALLFYIHQKGNGIKRKNLKSIMVSTHFWHRVYNRFFTDANVTLGKMSILQKRSPSYRFQEAFSKFKTRTAFAKEMLQKNCLNTTYSESELADYKNNPDEYYCNEKLMPNINDMFFQQNKIVAGKYYLYEIQLIHQVFDDDLKNFINQKNVTIKPIQEFWKNRCFRCAAYSNRPKLSSSIDLFQISDGSNSAIYALIRSKNGMRLLPAWNMDAFLDEIGLNSRAKLDVPFMAEDMKSASKKDDFNSFAIYIAKSREKMFLANLKSTGYEATTTEKVVNFFKHLIPFYACAESIRESDSSTQTVMACIVDSLVLVPFFGLATSVGTKITIATMRSTLLRLGMEMEAFTLREAFKAVMKVGLRMLASDIIESLSQIVTKQFIQDFGIAVLRSLDPGIEFSFMLTKAGVKTLMHSWKWLKSKFSIKSLVNLKSVTNIKIGTYKGFDVHVQSVTGNDGFGLKTIDFQGRFVELRGIRGYANEMPVVVVNNARRLKKYKIIDLQTGRLGETEWVEENGILIKAVKPLRVRLKVIQVEGLSGRGIVTMEMKRTKMLEALEYKFINSVLFIEDPSVQKVMLETVKQYVLENVGQTYHSLIQYWLKYKTLPPWCEKYKLTDRALYDKLRFSSFLEVETLFPANAINRITNSYGEQFVRNVVNVNLNTLYDFYISRELHGSITFDDQFALANFITSGNSRMHLDDFEVWNMKSALYKTAIRQFDDDSFLKLTNDILYSIEVRNYDFSLPFEPKIYDITEFTILSRQMDELLQEVKHVRDKSLIKVLHKIKLHHHCLAVYLERYLPFNTENVVLLPGIKFALESWRYNLINGENILVINWKSLEFDKSKWLTDTTNKIKVLLDRK